MDLHAERELAQGLREGSGQSWRTLYDAFALRVTDKITERQSRALKTKDYIARRTEIDYATYARLRGKLTME